MSRIDPAAVSTTIPLEAPELPPINEKSTTAATPPRSPPALSESARSPDLPAYGEIRSLLSRGLTDWAVTDGDVEKVHGRLGGLPPHTYRLTLEQMDRDGLLSKYVDELDATQRKAFLDQLAEKGLVERRTYAAPSGPLAPPVPPDTFKRDPNVPKAVHAAIHEYENDAANAYRHQYGEYAGRYCEAVGQANSAAELRSIGNVAPPVELSGLLAYGSVVSASLPNKAVYAVTDKLKELQGESSGPFALKAGLELGEFLKYTAELKAGPGAVQLEQKGKVEASSGEDGVHVVADSEGIEKVGVSVLGASAAGYRDGTVRLELSGLGGYAEVGNGRFEEGVQLDIPGVKAWVGVEMNGLSKEEARRAVAGKLGFFDSPEQLKAGVAWGALGEETRSELEGLGWTEAEWRSRSR